MHPDQVGIKIIGALIQASSKPDFPMKPCERCHTPSTLRYRVIYEPHGQWSLICKLCWQAVSQANPHYRYGGTWKVRR